MWLTWSKNSKLKTYVCDLTITIKSSIVKSWYDFYSLLSLYLSLFPRGESHSSDHSINFESSSIYLYPVWLQATVATSFLKQAWISNFSEHLEKKSQNINPKIKICNHKSEPTKWLLSRKKKDALENVNSFHRIDDTCTWLYRCHCILHLFLLFTFNIVVKRTKQIGIQWANRSWLHSMCVRFSCIVYSKFIGIVHLIEAMHSCM